LRVVAKAPHRLGFPADTGEAIGIETLGFDKREGDVSVKFGVVGEIDALPSAFAEKALDRVTALDE